MHDRMKLWFVVWAVVAVVGLVGVYPSGQSTILFGFWPSNHFYIFAWTLLTLIVGMVFAYDNMYKMYPPEQAQEIERTGGGFEVEEAGGEN